MITRRDIKRMAKDREPTEHDSFDIYEPKTKRQDLLEIEIKACGYHYTKYMVGDVCKGFTVYLPK